MTLTESRPLLIPTGDPTPVEKAVVDGIVGDFEPETYLQFVFHQPDGGARMWHGWTTGGAPLGEQTDQAALGASMDLADWFAITGRYSTEHHRGRVEITAYPLRPILGDVQNGRGDTGQWQDSVRRVLEVAAKDGGSSPAPADVRLPWLGCGPTLVGTRP